MLDTVIHLRPSVSIHRSSSTNNINYGTGRISNTTFRISTNATTTVYETVNDKIWLSITSNLIQEDEFLQ